MQALTRTLFLCYAAADCALAAQIAAFLEAGAGVRVLFAEGEIRAGEDLVQKAREARMADIVLVLFSRNSLPSPWPRYKWEAAMTTEPIEEGIHIAFLKGDDCSPPRVLAPQFDLTGLPVAALRRLKRWVRSGSYSEPALHHPELAQQVEDLARALADRAGAATVASPTLALELTRLFREDFDDVIRLECGGRSLTALAGDLATQLGLRLEGDLEGNLARLRSFCAARRYLIWLEGASADEADRLGSESGSSTLITADPRPEPPPEDESLRNVQYTFRHPGMADDWAELCRLARHGLRLAAEQGRYAESFEVLGQWHALAEARGDRRILEESAREIVWILEGWNRFEEARSWEYRRAMHYDEQMALPIPITTPPPSQLLLAHDEAPEIAEEKRLRVPRPEQFSLF